MPIYTPIIIKSGSIEVLSKNALNFVGSKPKWTADLENLKAASIHIAVVTDGNKLEFFYDQTSGDRTLTLSARGLNFDDLTLQIGSQASQMVVINADKPQGKQVGKRLQYDLMKRVDEITLVHDRGATKTFDQVKHFVVLVESEDLSYLPARRHRKVGSGAVFAAIGFVAGLAAGAFLAGGLDDGGW